MSDEPPRRVKVGELQVGDFIVLPFPDGYSAYLILEVRRREDGDARLDLRFFTTGRTGPDLWSEVAWSIETPEDDFARSAVLLRRQPPTDEE